MGTHTVANVFLCLAGWWIVFNPPFYGAVYMGLMLVFAGIFVGISGHTLQGRIDALEKRMDRRTDLPSP